MCSDPVKFNLELHIHARAVMQANLDLLRFLVDDENGCVPVKAHHAETLHAAVKPFILWDRDRYRLIPEPFSTILFQDMSEIVLPMIEYLEKRAASTEGKEPIVPEDWFEKFLDEHGGD